MNSLQQHGLLEETHRSTSTEISSSVPISEQVDYTIQQSHDIQLSDGKFLFIFAQENIYYFKHESVIELDRTFGDIKNDIYDLQRNLTIQLEEKLLEMELELLKLSELLSTFDVYSSLGLLAIYYKLVKPQIVEDPLLVIKNGRHLLQELTVDNFVPNDTYVTTEQNIALITGPNSSGKSIYLKQVGLIVYLAHIGSWVPCERAIIGLTDQILTRISSEETVSTPQSTFTIDLCQVSKLLKFHTCHSLCLVDEFGKGTTPTDGMALLAAIIQHFVPSEYSCRCLFVLHFTEIIQSKILHDHTNTLIHAINCFRMETLKEVMVGEDDWEGVIAPDKDTITDVGQLIPLYKLKYGMESDSEGINCALTMGISKEVIKRAQNIKRHIQEKAPIERYHDIGWMSMPMYGNHDTEKNMCSTPDSVASGFASGTTHLITTYHPLIRDFLRTKDWFENDTHTTQLIEKLKKTFSIHKTNA